jgi:hypothetical protein
VKKLFASVLFLILGIVGYFSATQSRTINYFDIASRPSAELVATDKGLLNVGRAPFAITAKRFQCKNFLDSLDDLQVLNIAFLYNTFGNKFDCIKTLMHDPRLARLEINLINEPCHRNRRCQKHEFLSVVSSPQKYDQLLKAKDAKLKARFDAYVIKMQELLAGHLQDHTQCYINPGLESNVGLRAAKTLVSWAKEAFPQCKIVWNPLKPSGETARSVGADFIEGHGPGPNLKGPCITNLDGTDINFPERTSVAVKTYVEGQPKNWVNSGAALQSYAQEYANKCEMVLFWGVEDNCNDSGFVGGFIPPTDRQCRVGIFNKLTAKEVKTAHTKGRRLPKDLTYNDEDMNSFQGCDEIKDNWNDGAKRGRLLKQSEFSDRGGVILTSSDLNGSRSIQIFARGKKVESYEKKGQYTHDSSRRDLWRSNISPTKYPFKVAVRITTNRKIVGPDGKQKNKLVCYKIPNPTIRQD